MAWWPITYRRAHRIQWVATAIVVALLAAVSARMAPARPATPACHLSDLRLAKGTQRDTAGNFHLAIVFVNRSHHTCTLRGFPGVYSVGSHLDQLGALATRDHSLSAATVVLHPGGRAHSDYVQKRAALFDPMDCQPVWASWLEVFPPGSPGMRERSGEAAYLPWKRLACTAHGPGDSSVRAVQSGPG